MAISYRCSECGKKAKQGVDAEGGEGALYCPKHPRAVIDSVVGPGRPKGKGPDTEALLLRLSPSLLATVTAAAGSAGVTRVEWLRRAAAYCVATKVPLAHLGAAPPS